MESGSKSMEEISFISTTGNPSLTHQEVVSYDMYEPPTKKIRSLSASIINAAHNVKLAAKITITQEEGSIDYFTTYVEETLTETSKASAKPYTKDTPQKRTATMMASSKTQNYHICEILYNLYKYHIFQNKK